MSILISHRGNLNGPDPSRENSPEYIQETLDAGFNVEVDVLGSSVGFYLGHDKPQYKIDMEFLQNEAVWCHAKNLQGLVMMLHIGGFNCFWHENDAYTLTSNGYIWTYPRQPLCPLSIAVYPELYPDNTDFNKGAGICSDHIINYR